MFCMFSGAAAGVWSNHLTLPIYCATSILHIFYTYLLCYIVLCITRTTTTNRIKCVTHLYSPSTHQFECAKTQGTSYVFPHIIDTSGMICGICMYIVMRILIKQTIYIYVHINVLCHACNC